MESNKKRSIIIICVIAVMLAAVIVYDAFFSFVDINGSTFAMGSAVTYKLHDKEEIANEVRFTATKGIENLDKTISRNIKDSDISKINKNLSYEVSDDTVNYINECIKISELTNGKFDITVGALSSLWDFDNEKKIVPDDNDIQKALLTVGCDKIKISGNTVTVAEGTVLDLGAVGKGLACGIVNDKMNSVNLKRGVVSVGGSVGTYGENVVIGIRDPFGETTDTVIKLKIKNAVASTSGNYEKYFEKDGVRYHHILDAKTGYPVQNDLVSVTVICKSGIASDALSTACYTLDYKGSKKVLDEYDAMAVFIYKDKTVKIYNEKYEYKIADNDYERK